MFLTDLLLLKSFLHSFTRIIFKCLHLSQDGTLLKNFVELFGRPPIVVWPDQKLGEVLSVFKHKRAHMAIVRDVNSSREVFTCIH